MGTIDSARELVSELFGGVPDHHFASGLDVLKYYDEHATHDGAFTAAEAEAAGIEVCVDANHDGKTDSGELKTFAELGIIQINLAGRAESGLVLDGNEVRYTLSFKRNVNAAGAAVPLDTSGSHPDNHDHEAIEAALIANPFGTTSRNVANGELVVTATDASVGLRQTKRYVSSTTPGETINLATVDDGKKVDNAFGGTGNDTLNGNDLNNWIGGGQGSDAFNGGLGNDVLLIDSADLQANIHGGDGTGTVQVIGHERVMLNLAQAEVAIAQGDAALYGTFPASAPGERTFIFDTRKPIQGPVRANLTPRICVSASVLLRSRDQSPDPILHNAHAPGALLS